MGSSGAFDATYGNEAGLVACLKMVSISWHRPFRCKKSNKHIEIPYFAGQDIFRIMPAMSIRNVKIDFLGLAAVGVFVLFLLAPLVL